jgi:hypothetical protein
MYIIVDALIKNNKSTFIVMFFCLIRLKITVNPPMGTTFKLAHSSIMGIMMYCLMISGTNSANINIKNNNNSGFPEEIAVIIGGDSRMQIYRIACFFVDNLPINTKVLTKNRIICVNPTYNR